MDKRNVPLNSLLHEDEQFVTISNVELMFHPCHLVSFSPTLQSPIFHYSHSFTLPYLKVIPTTKEYPRNVSKNKRILSITKQIMIRRIWNSEKHVKMVVHNIGEVPPGRALSCIGDIGSEVCPQSCQADSTD